MGSYQIPERQEEINWLFREFLSESGNTQQVGTAVSNPRPAIVASRTAQEVAELLCKDPQRRAIFEGSNLDYESDSEADGRMFANLSWFCEKDVELMREVAELSARRRPKWYEKRRHTDWLGREIEKAAERQIETIDPKREASFKTKLERNGEQLSPSEDTHFAKKPEIQINNRHLQDITEDALRALAASNDPAELFVRSGSLVRVAEDENGVPAIQKVSEDGLRGRLARVAFFYRLNASRNSPEVTRADPPGAVVRDILALPARAWVFPALEAIVETPILRAAGTIHDTPGYDPETRLYYRPAPGFDMEPVPENPSDAELARAIEWIDEAVGEFPYADRASAANTLAYLLSPVVRQAIDGCAPLAVIDKPQAGTGGSLLAEVAGEIGSGRSAEMLGAPSHEEEWRKTITSKLSEGATMVTIDNVEGALWAPSLARALTARIWTDRELGRTGTITVKQRATWAATGNNIMLRGDLPRRCYWIRLDAKQARPWQRQQFKHPALLSWVRANRGHLVHSLLTIARSWYAAGCPKDETLPHLGSFESWTATIGGMVSHAGFHEFLGNLEELYEKAAEGEAEWEVFLEAWWRQRGEDSITGKNLAKLIEDQSALKDALPAELAEALDKGGGAFTRKLGKALAKRVGTRYGEDGLHIVDAGEYRRAKLWSVQDSSGECEFVSFVSFYNPTREIFDSKENTVGGEKNSTDSQTHTEQPEKEPWEQRQADIEKALDEDLVRGPGKQSEPPEDWSEV
jgi:hypothetical protein